MLLLIMAKINLVRKLTKPTYNVKSYKMVLEVVSSENITRYVFVKQRIRDPLTETFKDAFAAVASPAQLEEFDERSPAANSSYFRDYKVELVSYTAEYLDEVFTSILYDIQKLVEDFEIIDNIEPDGIFSITATSIDKSMAILHQHYRLPMTASPCGINNVVDAGGGVMIHQIGSPNPALSGWLPVTLGVDPENTYFKYNITTDAALNALWPIPSELISYAHIEYNGATTNDVLINETGIYWKTNLEGKAPWPKTYVNEADRGLPEDEVVLLIDLIV